MPMKNPPHPGLAVRYDCLEPLGLSVTQGAKILGVTRQTLNNLVNGKAAISPEMAIRLDKAFGGGPRPGFACRRLTTSLRPKNAPTKLKSDALLKLNGIFNGYKGQLWVRVVIEFTIKTGCCRNDIFANRSSMPTGAL